MGNAQCQKCQQLKIEQNAYGEFDLLIDSHHEYAAINKSISKQQIKLEQLKKQLEKRLQISSIHIVKLQQYKIVQDLQFYHITLLYQYFNVSLKEKSDYWKEHKTYIREAELGNLILGIENAINQLYSLGIAHRAINMHNVLCINSVYKTTDTSMTSFLTGLDLALQGDEQQFLSPSMLIVRNHKGSDPKYKRKDDLFSLGLMIICVILQCQPKELYIEHSSDFSFNLSKIKQGLLRIQERYEKWILKKVQYLIEAQSLFNKRSSLQISETQSSGGKYLKYR